MRIFLLLSLLCCLGLFFLPGCSTLHPDMEDPVITVVNLQPGEMKGLEAVFALELRVMNPNDFPLDIEGVNCRLLIDGNRLANGISNAAIRVPPFGTEVVPVTIYASMVDMVTSAIELLRESGEYHGQLEPIGYELKGTVRLAGMGSVPFRSEGRLDLGGFR